MDEKPDLEPNPIAHGMMWVHRIMTAALMLVIPPFVGNWLDKHWAMSPWLLILGTLMGMAASSWHFYRILVALSKE
jgi:F0F1-type ATP synthase assembly protein I